VEKNTPLYTKVLDGKIIMPTEEVDLNMFEFCQKYLRSHGYSQYEISNYSRGGMECFHSLHYWNLEPCLAFGPSVHGYDGHIRWWNTSSLDAYIQMLEHNEKPVSGSERLSQTDHFNEAVFNGLRTREGIQLRNIHSWETDLKKMNPAILKWKDQLDITKDAIFLKSDSYKYADAIASDMMIIKPQ
jgi:oxygen-independent coproporphyrinogen-3 oxidase